MLLDIVWVLGVGFIGAKIAENLRIPPLVGMILGGILGSNQVANVFSNEILLQADTFRTIAVTVILIKAGLGLEREKLSQQGIVALQLGFLPALFEMLIVTVLAHFLLDFSWLTGLLLGCILSAESPAVIVPGMLRLKSLGWGRY